jgi:hypothetical protein
MTFVGGDLLHNVLVVDAQQYRATWPLAVVANLFVATLLLRIRWSITSPLTRAALAFAVAMLILSRFIFVSAFVAAPAVAFAALALTWEQIRQRPMPTFVGAFGIVVLALVCWKALALLGAYMMAIGHQPTMLHQTIRGLGITVAALGAVGVYITASSDERGGVMRPLIVFAAVLAALTAFGWDQRMPWTKFIETTEAVPESLSSLLPQQGLVYWEGDVRVPWFVLKRPSYFSCAQGTGALFFRGTAITYQDRYETLEPLRTLDFGQEFSCPLPRDPETVSYSREALASICTKEPELGALVLTRPVANAPARIWVSPARFGYFRWADGNMQAVATDRFFIYACADLR